MFSFLKQKQSDSDNNVTILAKQKLAENRAVFESLREYDEGKKDISTSNVKRHLHRIHPST